MTKQYINDRVWGLEGFGISDVFKIDTNIDGDFESFCIEGNGEEILDIIMLLSEDKVLNGKQEDRMEYDTYDNIEELTQFSKDFSQEQLAFKAFIKEEDIDAEVVNLRNILDSLQHYGIKSEKLVEKILTISEKVNNIIVDASRDEEDSDGGFFNSLFNIYNKEIAYSLIDTDPTMQWAF